MGNNNSSDTHTNPKLLESAKVSYTGESIYTPSSYEPIIDANIFPLPSEVSGWYKTTNGTKSYIIPKTYHEKINTTGAIFPFPNGNYHFIALSDFDVIPMEFIPIDYHPIIANAKATFTGDSLNINSSKLEDVMVMEHLNSLPAEAIKDTIDISHDYIKLWRDRNEITMLLKLRKESRLWYWLLLFIFLILVFYILYRMFHR